MSALEAVAGLLGPWVAQQRWAVKVEDDGAGGAADLRIEHAEVLFDTGGGWPRVLWYLAHPVAPPASGGEVLYQALVAVRPADSAIDLGERDILGYCDTEDGRLFAYDALVDPEAARGFAGYIGLEGAEEMTVRPVGADQSNSSVVLGDKARGDRVILKVYRRVRPGSNPDVEVPAGLDRVGFNHLAAPMAAWRRGEYDLAVAQEYLAGGVEGWALALASLRDLYAGQEPDPGRAGGDFSSEARRIGDMTARLHVALGQAFGLHPHAIGTWTDITSAQAEALGLGAPVRRGVDAVIARTRRLAETGAIGPAIRVHGDYHLAQVMRTDNGWYVLDFEGEPERSLADRRTPWPAVKDVAGMLRSFDYAAGAGLAERVPSERDALRGRARSWEEANRQAFLEGYRAVEGIGALLPEGDASGRATAELTDYFELDKALYELAYERAHRPDWEWIPRDAIEQLLKG